jgi:hypothetical protein
MKKLFFAAIITFGLVGFASAQTTQTAKPAPAKSLKPATTTKPTAPTSTTAKPINATAPAVKVTPTATPTKADGTPDMRFKSNKTKATAKPVGPTKADGTPDMRYKSNKTATKKG